MIKHPSPSTQGGVSPHFSQLGSKVALASAVHEAPSSQLKILVINSLFQPEPSHIRGLKFAQELIRRGHSVQVLTGFPNYPGGKLYPGYRIRWRMREIIEGVEVLRVPHYPSHDQSGFRRFLNYFSFALSASTIGTVSVRRPDIIHVCQGASTLIFPAAILRLIYKCRVVLDIQDLWPESVTSSGMLRFPGGERLLHRLSAFTYWLSDRIIVLSEGYKNVLVQRGVEPTRIDTIYNYCDESSVSTMSRDVGVGVQFGLAGRFNAVFAGTMGKLQALDVLLNAAEILREQNGEVQIVFVGGGIELPKLMATAAAKRLTNVRFIPRQPISEISKILAFADALIIHLRSDSLGAVGVPQKTQAYLAAGRPIVAAVDGEAANLVEKACAGIVCMPENGESIADAILRLACMTPSERNRLGQNGRSYYYEHLSFTKGVSAVLDTFLSSLPKDGTTLSTHR